jgi:hypothetical protein
MTDDDVAEICRRRRKARTEQPADQRETLVPCPACGGDGKRIVDDDGSTYRIVGCPWCDGSGSTDSFMIKLFNEMNR